MSALGWSPDGDAAVRGLVTVCPKAFRGSLEERLRVTLGGRLGCFDCGWFGQEFDIRNSCKSKGTLIEALHLPLPTRGSFRQFQRNRNVQRGFSRRLFSTTPPRQTDPTDEPPHLALRHASDSRHPIIRAQGHVIQDPVHTKKTSIRDLGRRRNRLLARLSCLIRRRRSRTGADLRSPAATRCSTSTPARWT